MGYIDFDRNKLVNLSYSLDKELLRTNRKGAYASTTLIRCNTRKYHGMLVAPQPAIDDELHVLVSAVDPTIIQNNAEFNLGIHQYPGGIFVPRGHKYVRELHSDPIPKSVYRVGGVIFSVEQVFSREAHRVFTRYTLEDCHSPTTIRLKPYLAFRQRHQLSKANEWVDKKFRAVPNGVVFKMYRGYSPVYMQFSKKVDYIHNPDWYYNIEYAEEQRRGYEYQEDLFVPGYFEFPLKKGESIVMATGIEEVVPSRIKSRFRSEVERRMPRNSFKNCLLNAAEQFVVRRDKKQTEIIAGYPWFGTWGRDTFISLPGLTLSSGAYSTFTQVMDTAIARMKGPLFPNNRNEQHDRYNSADAPLWFVWAVKKYHDDQPDDKALKRYYKVIKKIIKGYIKGTDFNIHMADNSLIWQGQPGLALTWMDAIVGGKPVTPRIGFAVEINALWYNAIATAEALALAFDDKPFAREMSRLRPRVKEAFNTLFWDDDKGRLADVSTGEEHDWSIRPNMLLAVSMPYSPLSLKKAGIVVKTVREHLLTVRGLRSLSPMNPDYKGHCEGGVYERDRAYHQGTAWPWLFGHFVEAWLKVYKKLGVRKMEWYLEQWEDTMTEHGIGTISEIYDGDPPHTPRGCISQAWSVAEILRAERLIEKAKNQNP